MKTSTVLGVAVGIAIGFGVGSVSCRTTPQSLDAAPQDWRHMMNQAVARLDTIATDLGKENRAEVTAMHQEPIRTPDAMDDLQSVVCQLKGIASEFAKLSDHSCGHADATGIVRPPGLTNRKEAAAMMHDLSTTDDVIRTAMQVRLQGMEAQQVFVEFGIPDRMWWENGGMHWAYLDPNDGPTVVLGFTGVVGSIELNQGR